MALTAEQMGRITTVLRMRMRGPCPVCEIQNWVFGENLVILQSLASPGPPAPRRRALLTASDFATEVLSGQPGPAYPTLPVMCGNCGNTVLMNVYKLNIADLWAGQIPPTPQA